MEINNSPRRTRPSPVEAALIQQMPQIPQTLLDANKPTQDKVYDNIPYKIRIRSRKNATINPAETVAAGQGNTVWTINERGMLKLTKIKIYISKAVYTISVLLQVHVNLSRGIPT